MFTKTMIMTVISRILSFFFKLKGTQYNIAQACYESVFQYCKLIKKGSRLQT